MKRRKRIYLYAALLTLVLYALGLASGYYISARAQDARNADLSDMKSYIQDYTRDLENIQLEQLYLSSSGDAIACQFMLSDVSKLQNNLAGFLKILPAKLEVYESGSNPDSAYEQIKKDYALLSLRVWVLSVALKDKCKEDIVPILYFYSRDCTQCIEQGNILDSLRAGYPLAVFTIDANLNEPIVHVLAATYNITKTPSLIINNSVYPGLRSLDELRKVVSG